MKSVIFYVKFEYFGLTRSKNNEKTFNIADFLCSQNNNVFNYFIDPKVN